MHVSRLVSIVLGFLTLCVSARAQTGPDFTQVTRPVVEVTDSDLIEYLLFELIIEPLEAPTRLQVIDVTQNGYGPDDVIVAYPTTETFLIPEFIPDSVQAVMSAWIPEVDFKLDAGNLPSDALAALIDDDDVSTNRAEKTILYEVVQAVERNYHDLPVGILFERDSLGFTFQIWDYNPAAMRYTPKQQAVSDSSVFAVFELLKDIGYLPSGAVGAGGTATPTPLSRLTSARAALMGIGSVPDEERRRLATRTILLGSFDIDRSGMIDSAREVDAVSCDIWKAVEVAFPDFLNRFGFEGPDDRYLGAVVFGISSAVRGPMARRGNACKQGSLPAATTPTEVEQTARPEQLPDDVAGFYAMEASVTILETAGRKEAGSADWADAVAEVMIERFDPDASGMIDRIQEVEAVPCAVWKSIAATGDDLPTGLGFDGSSPYVGHRIGVHLRVRQEALSSIIRCVHAQEPTALLRVPPRPTGSSTPPGAASRFAAAKALSGIASVEDEEKRTLAAKTILLGYDGSGHIDTAVELDAIPCDAWTALEGAFTDFARRYGFEDDTSVASSEYLGSFAFNISRRLRRPAGRRVAACLAGRTPPATLQAEVGASNDGIRIPVALRHFLDTSNALRVATATSRLEAGSAAWASAVRDILLEKYDLDRSGLLDSSIEIQEIPCVVWNTVVATNGGSLGALGLGGRGEYFGDLLGIAEGSRSVVSRRLNVCAAS